MTNDELINLAVLTEQIKEDLEAINEIISQYINVESKPVKKKKNWKELSMSEILIRFGITPNLNGFRYILDAVTMLKEHNNISVTKELYPNIAEKYKTTASRVERAIRHCINVAYKKYNEDFQREFSEDLPTNSEFLAILAVRY